MRDKIIVPGRPGHHIRVVCQGLFPKYYYTNADLGDECGCEDCKIEEPNEPHDHVRPGGPETRATE